MKPAKLLFSLLFLLSLLISVNCSSPHAGKDLTTPTETVSNPESYWEVRADENLQQIHKDSILNALDEWAIETHNTLTYKLTFVDMSTETPDSNTPHVIKIYVKDPGPGLLGWTEWDPDFQSAYTLVEPSIDAELFRRIMLHELGHAFNLDFDGNTHYVGPYASVMHPVIDDDSLHLSCPELQAFCNNYGCQVDCTFVSEDAGSAPQQTNALWVEVQKH